MGGLAWQLLEQDRDLETSAPAGQLEQTADALVAAMQQALADLQAHVGAESPPGQPLPPGVVAISIASDHLASSPAGRLLYYPAPPSGRQVSPLVFAEGERLEFTTADTAAAVEIRPPRRPEIRRAWRRADAVGARPPKARGVRAGA